jgi:hypothetical protein
MSQIIKFTQSSLRGDYSILTVSEIEIEPMKESQKEQNKSGTPSLAEFIQSTARADGNGEPATESASRDAIQCGSRSVHSNTATANGGSLPRQHHGNIRAQPGEHQRADVRLSPSSVVFKTCNRKFNKR